MKKVILLLILLASMIIPSSATEYTAPDVPESGELYMPEDTQSFSEGLMFVLGSALKHIAPEITDALQICVKILLLFLLISIVDAVNEQHSMVIHLAASVLLGIMMLQPASALFRLAFQTIQDMTQYGKLLIPVMSAALAAQGGITSSAALYAGTTVFISILSLVISSLIIPLLYIYICISICCGALADKTLCSIRDFIKWLVTWILKIILYVFTGYISITGVITGTTDASALKAAKLAISGTVPVVGSIISDASDTVLISAGFMKNTAGIYGIIAVFAVFVGPFLKIGVQYLALKLTAGLCSTFGKREEVAVLNDCSNAMGLALASIGTMCLMLFIGIVCFIKGVSL